ncbi:MAG: VWA domain-containing protein [Mariniblastus sp.]
MSDPTLKRFGRKLRSDSRTGAVMPLFAFIFPVLILLAGFAINLAWMQLLATELKIATDASCHAGGRAMSLNQTTEAAITEARRVAQLNTVGGHTLSVGDENSNSDVVLTFGVSVRGGDNGQGMYQFTEVDRADVDSGAARATSLAVTASPDFGMAFNVMALKRYQPVRRSIATQVDRDIALVLDRSGSMLYYQDEEALEDVLDWLRDNERPVWVPSTIRRYRYWYWHGGWRGWWEDRGYMSHSEAGSSWRWDYDSWDYRDDEDGGSFVDRAYITDDEHDDATDSLYQRDYSNNVIYQVENYHNPDHTLGDSYSSSESDELVSPMAQYLSDWEYVSSSAPRYSSWWYVEQGVETFLTVLESTAQDERVSLVTFSSSATLDQNLLSTYGPIRSDVFGTYPDGGTAIGAGMDTGLPPIISGSAARPFAAKTIIVLTDGVSGDDPVDSVEDIVADNDVTIHTMTFTSGADRDTMEEVARIGRGRAYHADDGADLMRDFNEIANNLPTILTE